MDLSVWITYFIATIILSVTPGPGVFSSISSGLHHGFRLGLWNGIGMHLSSVICVCPGALGLGAILIPSQTMFNVVKWLGVIHPGSLALLPLPSPPPPLLLEPDPPP